MQEMVNRRQGGRQVPVDEIWDGFYNPKQEKRHKSPTKRLISLKNSTWDHKKRISDNISKGDYSQTYCIAPGKSYVIEPEGGELPYELAERSPKKFYEQVLNQEIKRYEVKMRGKITGEWTQRPLLKIISGIKERVIQRIA
jgi:hypothetical protein